jgi:hypothetical protein
MLGTTSTETIQLVRPDQDVRDTARYKQSRYSAAVWMDYSAWDLAAGGLFFVVASLIALTFTHYGVTWDEPIQNRYGAEIVQYYRMLLRGHYVLPLSSSPERNLYLYGGLFDTLAAPFNLFRHRVYEARHLFNALFGLLGIVGCWKVARFVGGPAVGFLSALLLVITPRYYGGMFNNPKDIPFAVGYIWAVYYLLQFAKQLPDISPRINVKLGLAIGVALATRIGGLILLGYLGLIVGLWFIAYSRSVGLTFQTIRACFPVVRSGALITAISWAVMLLFWPWAQVRPFTRPFQALTRFSYFADWQGMVLFRGSLVKSTELPRVYILQWLVITLPEIFLAALAVALLYGVWRLFAIRRQGIPVDLRNGAILLLAGLFPIVYVIAKKSILYNAERHVTFVVAPLACLAAWGSYLAVSKLGPAAKRAVALSVFAYLIFHVNTMVRLHPDEYVYFNQLVGGLKGANGRYDTDYWGNSFREAVQDLSSYLSATNGNSPQRKYKIYLKYIDKACVTYYFPPNFSVTYDPDEADYFIANTSIGTDKFLDGKVVATVERLGVPLAVVKELPAAKIHQSAVTSKVSSGNALQRVGSWFLRISDRYFVDRPAWI